MKREEVLALGVPEERLREFQDLYSRDLQKQAKQLAKRAKGKPVRAAIESMLPLIRDEQSLREILQLVTQRYCDQIRMPQEDDV